MSFSQQAYNEMPEKPPTAEQLFQIDYLKNPSKFDSTDDTAAQSNDKKNFKLAYKQLDSFTKLDYMNNADYELENYQQKYLLWQEQYKDEAQKILESIKTKEISPKAVQLRRQYYQKLNNIVPVPRKHKYNKTSKETIQTPNDSKTVENIPNKLSLKSQKKEMSLEEKNKIIQEIYSLNFQRQMIESDIQQYINQILKINQEQTRLKDLLQDQNIDLDFDQVQQNGKEKYTYIEEDLLDIEIMINEYDIL